MSAHDKPDLETVIESDDPELVDEYNAAVEDELDEQVAELEAEKQDAVAALREDAQESLETETVTMPGSGTELEVRARMSPHIESLQDKLQRIEDGEQVNVPEGVIHAFDRLSVDDFVDLGQVEQSRHLNAYLLAEMVESPPKFADPDVWAVASRDGDAGLQWLAEATDVIIGPARTNAEDIHEGNSRTDSENTPNQQRGRRSGGWVKR
jgi:hypothetical protein